MFSKTEQGVQQEEGEDAVDKLQEGTKALIVVQDKPLSPSDEHNREEEDEKQQQCTYNCSDSLNQSPPVIVVKRPSSCADNDSLILLEKENSRAKLRKRLSSLSINLLWRKQKNDDFQKPPEEKLGTKFRQRFSTLSIGKKDDNSECQPISHSKSNNSLIKTKFQSLQNLSKISKWNTRSSNWCCGSKATIRAIMDKNRPKVKPKETSTRGITRSSLMSASEIGSRGNLADDVGSLSSTSSAEYGSDAPDVPVRFVWDHGGDKAHVCIMTSSGTKTTLELDKNTSDTPSVLEGKSCVGAFETIVCLKPGRCEFR